ncbi:hypothetical protein [Geobacillus jurassicus]|uniref:Uncharacterized protein n=1 Tax=Geobacillus jurassicus TaxID=235932 RepID=A0ABV6GSM2_9BACL|nr:hypothetical protein [Geobacillus jurassicus]
MKWEDICQAFPNRWVLIEVVDAYTNEDNKRILNQVVPIEAFSDPMEAMRAYKRLHKEIPHRELYVLHTNRKEINISERRWTGVWRG